MAIEASLQFRPPASADELEERLLRLEADATYRDCVAYVKANPEKMASSRRDEVARAATTSEATLTSFAQALGFLGYAELRAFIRRDYPLGPRRSDETGRTDALFPKGANPFQNFMRDTLVTEIRNFEETYERNKPEAFMQAVHVLNAAQSARVVILGRRSCFSAAHLLHYLYNLFRGNAVLSADAGGAGVDCVRWLAPGDVLVVISLAPYSREIIQAITFAQKQGATILAITDDETSPLAKAAKASLFFDSATPSFFHSLGALNMVVQILAGLLFYSQPEESIRGFERAEEQLGFFSAYARVVEAEPSEDKSRKGSSSSTGLMRPGRTPRP